jgi:ubiquinone/menaquinone biosynthesis C-methylase UbiE
MSLPLDHRGRLDFVLTLRRRWADTVYPAVKAAHDARAAAAPTAETAAIVHGLPAYPWFAWMERGSQKMLWRAVSEAVAAVPAPPEPAADGPATLELDPALALPDWYTDWDIHVQPGGIWRTDAQARVYELGAKLVMMGDNDDYRFHRSFVDTALPKRHYRRIVDLGCGFGKSVWPMKQAFPGAEVIGIDLASPCLRLAKRKCDGLGLAVRFRQADARATGLETRSADLVTSTMLVHEMPVDALEALFAECARLLAPGGVLRFLDFQPTGDPFRDLAMREHGARNNEPFMPGMMDADLPAMAARAGLAGGRWVAFDERGAGLLDAARWPERAEWHFPWAVFEAERPA